MSEELEFSQIALDLEDAGLIWSPSIGDEICIREQPVRISILVDSAGLSPKELRSIYVWLPTVEQIIFQLESRQAVLKHAGLELDPKSMDYRTVIESHYGLIESKEKSLRGSLALSLRELLHYSTSAVH